jgi:hypothetical protein
MKGASIGQTGGKCIPLGPEKIGILPAGLKNCKAKKRVRFHSEMDGNEKDATAHSQKRVDVPAQEITGLCHSTLDLRTANGGLCGHFFETRLKQLANSAESCLGYLEIERLCKLVFYNAGDPSHNPDDHTLKGVIHLKKVLAGLDMVRQLRLALKVSKAVLSFHTTPWLPPNWQLQDLAFFGEAHRDLDSVFEDLRTLHFTAEIPRGSQRKNDVSATEHERNNYNIRNLTLANLGIALLEIGLKKDIKRFQRANEPHDVITARKLADGFQTPLGPQYQSIIRKCIHCDFAFGADLKTKELQDAVYSDVVCGIESLIRSCESLGLD